MPLELNRDDVMTRVDGDIVEFIFPGWPEPKRIPLKWLVVAAHPSMRNRVVMQAGSEAAERPLYSMTKKSSAPGTTFEWGVSEDDELVFLAFFTELAASCGRFVDAPPGV
jgi:hypothetical protein